MADFDPSQSVTAWILKLKKGERDAVGRIWDRYFLDLAQVARTRLKNTPKRSFDEEDVVLSVFDSLCRGAEQGRFRELSDREDLWILLLAITRQKAVDRIRHGLAQKRGGQMQQMESFLDNLGSEEGLSVLFDKSPDGAFLADMQERCDKLMESLKDDDLRQIAKLRLEGHSVQEMAEHFQRTTRWVERKLALIRKIWSQDECHE